MNRKLFIVFKLYISFLDSPLDKFSVVTHGMQGIEPRVLWIGIGGSIFFGVLEKTKSMLAERRNRELVKDEWVEISSFLALFPYPETKYTFLLAGDNLAGPYLYSTAFTLSRT